MILFNVLVVKLPLWQKKVYMCTCTCEQYNSFNICGVFKWYGLWHVALLDCVTREDNSEATSC